MQADALGDAAGVFQVGVGHHHHELLAAVADGQVDGAHVRGQAHGELGQHLVADVVAEAVVDPLEVVDIDDQHRHGLAALGRAAHQGFQLTGHVAAVVQARELIGDRQLQRVVEVGAQVVGIALAADLGAHARRQLAGIDRSGQDVVDADLEGLHGLLALVQVGDAQDRQAAGSLVRTQLGGEAQAVERLGVQVDDHQVHRSTGGQHGLVGLALDHRTMLDGQFGRDALGLAQVVVDDEDAAARPAQARGRARDHAHAAARGLAVAQLVDHRLQARQAAHAGEQHHVVDGLGQEVVGARFQAGDPIGAAVQRGHQHHGHVAGQRIVLQPTADVEAVHAGHHHVEQHDIGQFGGRHRQRRRAVVGRQHLVVLRRQLGLEQAHVRFDVIDDEDARGHASSAAGGWFRENGSPRWAWRYRPRSRPPGSVPRRPSWRRR